MSYVKPIEARQRRAYAERRGLPAHANKRKPPRAFSGQHAAASGHGYGGNRGAMGYGAKLRALVLSVGFGAMLVPGCVIRIGQGGSGEGSGDSYGNGQGAAPF